jgi:hypothetical protein
MALAGIYYDGTPLIKFPLRTSLISYYFSSKLTLMRNLITLSCLIIFCHHAGYPQLDDTIQLPSAPNADAEQYAHTIREADLKNYLSILASDALEGRETGSRGQKMAAAFIREHFRDNKLDPIVIEDSDSLYFQKFKLYKNYYQEVYIESKDRKYRHLEDLLYIGNASVTPPSTMSLHFVGDGEEKDYQGLNVKDAMVAFFAKTPHDRQLKMKVAKENGATAFFILNTENKSEFDQYLDQNAQFFQSTSITKEKEQSGNDIIFIGHSELLAELLAVNILKLKKTVKKAGWSSKNPLRKVKSSSISIKIEKISDQFITENVLGFIEGSDKKEELVIITAHYDHLGIKGDQIFNGADDDGSGTAALMEIAQAFTMAKSNGHGPRRSLLFISVTAEEKGLLGSEFYSNNPAWPLDKTVANLNIDMIGRVDVAHENQDQYVYIIGSDRLSLDLHVINERMNKLYTHMELDYKYNAPDDPNRFYFRSDHYNFAKHNIPIIFYFNGTHADYHQSTDTIEKIRFDLLKLRTDLVFYCTWELANREERIRMNH